MNLEQGFLKIKKDFPNVNEDVLKIAFRFGATSCIASILEGVKTAKSLDDVLKVLQEVNRKL